MKRCAETLSFTDLLRRRETQENANATQLFKSLRTWNVKCWPHGWFPWTGYHNSDLLSDSRQAVVLSFGSTVVMTSIIGDETRCTLSPKSFLSRRSFWLWYTTQFLNIQATRTAFIVGNTYGKRNLTSSNNTKLHFQHHCCSQSTEKQRTLAWPGGAKMRRIRISSWGSFDPNHGPRIYPSLFVWLLQ